jgi:UDP-glucose 4-epimerase
VVAIFASRLLRGEEAVINGNGEQTRDFVFVKDVVAANMAVTDRPDLLGAFNVGTGVETSVNQLYDAMKFPAAAKHVAAKTGEQMRSVLDGSKLRRVAALPEPTPFAAGLQTTIEWFRAANR